MNIPTPHLVLALVALVSGALFFADMEYRAIFAAGVSFAMFALLFARWSTKDDVTGQLIVGSQVSVIIVAWLAVLLVAQTTLPTGAFVAVLTLETLAVTALALYSKPEVARRAAMS